MFAWIKNFIKKEKATFVIFKDADKKYRFRLVAPNHEIIAASEGYTRKENCLDGIVAVKKYSKSAVIEEQ
jgi:uncharacterized protein YegP (UPF0339 family)